MICSMASSFIKAKELPIFLFLHIFTRTPSEENIKPVALHLGVFDCLLLQGEERCRAWPEKGRCLLMKASAGVMETETLHGFEEVNIK